MMKLILMIAFIAVLISSLASGVVVNSVFVVTLAPGEEGLINIELEHTLEDDVTDISIRVDFADTPVRHVGNSEDGVDELGEGDEEHFVL